VASRATAARRRAAERGKGRVTADSGGIGDEGKGGAAGEKAKRRHCIRQEKGFISDLVAAGLLLARTDPDDEWLQVALALSFRNFSGETPSHPSTVAEGSAVSTDRSGGHEASLIAVHILRIDGLTTMAHRITKAGVTHGSCGRLGFPR
jgi:hypothetical protein